MTKCTQESFEFPARKRRVVEADLQGGDITPGGGVSQLRQADRHVGLCAAAALDDPRRRAGCAHEALSHYGKTSTFKAPALNVCRLAPGMAHKMTVFCD